LGNLSVFLFMNMISFWFRCEVFIQRFIPNAKNAAQHRVHRTSEGHYPHFRGVCLNGGFGVWWLFPPNPALAGNASR
jgi:hypothetical protein